MKKDTLLTLLLLVFGVTLNAQDKRPNVVFIMTDDHTIQAMSAYGSIINETPNLDRIAQNGIRFDQAFVTNAICAPSRAVIQTGKYSHINGQLDNSQIFDNTQQTFPKLMQQAGYQTALVGKWHLRSDPTGFDYWNVLPGQGLYYNPVFIEMGEKRNYTGYTSNLITDFAIDWLENRDNAQPFLLMVQHKAPHRNWMPDTPYLTKYDEVTIPEPSTLFDTYEGRGTAAKTQEMTIRNHMDLVYDLKVLAYPETNDDWMKPFMENRMESMTDTQRTAWLDAYNPKNQTFLEENLTGDALLKWKYQRYLKDYLRSVASMDDNVGRLLDYLEAQNLMENTLIIYTSDQGFYLGEHGWFDKRFMYEESFRTPMAIQFKGKILPERATKAMAMNLDIAPTILDFAGIKIPEDMQGVSLKPIVLQEYPPETWRQSVYYHYYEYPGVHAVKRHYGVRTDRFKLIHFYYDIDEWELYDLALDPHELTNVFNNPAYAEIRATLETELQRLQAYYQDDPEIFSKGLERKTVQNVAKDAKVTFRTMPDERYSHEARTALIDGKLWEYNPYTPLNPKDWLGFLDNPAEIYFDFGEEKSIQTLSVNLYQNVGSWIHYPTQIRVSVSDDEEFSNSRTTLLSTNLETKEDGIQLQKIPVNDKGRYLKVTLKPVEKIPAGMPGEGATAWIFLDEIVVEE